MTEEERRAEEERRQQKWVELRASCTVQGTFDQLSDAIESDIERFNKLEPKKRMDRRFKCSRQELSSIVIGQVNGSGEWVGNSSHVRVAKSTTKIHAYRNGDCLFSVAQEWNEETLTCDLKIDSKCYSIWQISQKAIGDLMFGYD